MRGQENFKELLADGTVYKLPKMNFLPMGNMNVYGHTNKKVKVLILSYMI